MRASSEKSPRIENSVLESLKTSLKEEITSEIKSFLVESQNEMLSLLKPKTGENVREESEDDPKKETRCFYTPTNYGELTLPIITTLAQVVTGKPLGDI